MCQLKYLCSESIQWNPSNVPSDQDSDNLRSRRARFVSGLASELMTNPRILKEKYGEDAIKEQFHLWNGDAKQAAYTLKCRTAARRLHQLGPQDRVLKVHVVA